jgi:hypothetical protein
MAIVFILMSFPCPAAIGVVPPTGYNLGLQRAIVCWRRHCQTGAKAGNIRGKHSA